MNPSPNTNYSSDSDNEDTDPIEFCENLLIAISFVVGILSLFMIPL